MDRQPIVLLGSGGHATCLVDIIEVSGAHQIAGVVTTDAGRINEFLGYPVLGGHEALPELARRGLRLAANGIGSMRDMTARRLAFAELKSHGFEVATLVHPSAVVSPRATLGEGVQMLQASAVQPAAVLGNDVIVYPMSVVGHGSVLGDHVLVSGGVTVGANVTVGDNCILSVGVDVVSGLSICENVLLGAGAAVTSDIREAGTYAGVPARRLEGN